MPLRIECMRETDRNGVQAHAPAPRRWEDGRVTAIEPNVVPFASPAASGGAPFVTTPVAYDAILLAGFGGPEGQDDVIPFLRNVTRGRGIPDERLEEVAHHYRHFGGVSPINGQNRVLKEALQKALVARGIDLPVYW